MNQQITALFLSDKGDKPSIIKLSVDNLLNDVKKRAGFMWATMPTYSLNGHNFMFICDDEGLLVDEPIATVFGKDVLSKDKRKDDLSCTYPIRLCGSLAVIHESSSDENGDDLYYDLTDEELQLLSTHLAMYRTSDGKIIHALVGVDYPKWED